MDRAQCMVIRNGEILMVVHRHDGKAYYCLPGGGVEVGETPIEAAARELKEECLVDGDNLQLISMVAHDGHMNYTYLADIGEQVPALGHDPELIDNPILAGVAWKTLESLTERDRAYLWAAGLFSIDCFAEELDSWGDDLSYPTKRG